MRLRYNDRLLQIFNHNHDEIAYLKLGLQGPRMQIEFPSDWHETQRAWITLGFGLVNIAFSFPWHKTVPDEGQCSGPTYGFYFFGDSLVLQWGKTKGTKNDPSMHIDMPWCWHHVNSAHQILTKPETHPYHYRLKNGIVQNRDATIHVETRTWKRWWIPWKMVHKTIDVAFSDEVGERSGSWKGGTIGCSYEMKPHETPLETLRRMERERFF